MIHSYAVFHLAIGLLLLFAGITIGKRTGAGSLETGLTIIGFAITIMGLLWWFVWFVITCTGGSAA